MIFFFKKKKGANKKNIHKGFDLVGFTRKELAKNAKNFPALFVFAMDLEDVKLLDELFLLEQRKVGRHDFVVSWYLEKEGFGHEKSDDELKRRKGGYE